MEVWQGKMARNLAHYDIVPDVHSRHRYDRNNNAPLYLPFYIQRVYLLVDFYCIGSPAVVLYNKTGTSSELLYF